MNILNVKLNVIEAEETKGGKISSSILKDLSSTRSKIR